MTIDTSGKWWVGSEPEDIKGYLAAYSADEYPVDEFRLARCSCGSLEFHLEADDKEGAAKRRCSACDAEHFLCDSKEYWDEADPETCSCGECGSTVMNIGVGFSLYEDKSAVRWLYVGVRCPRCGVLGCFAGWKIAYEPSLHLMEQV